MAKKKKSMQELGFKTISVYLRPEEYQALRKYCFDREIKHSTFIKKLILERLGKEKYYKDGGK
jgi:hypothetical protein